MGLPRSIRVDIDDGDFRVGNDRTACILNGALDGAQVSSLREHALGAPQT
jgi:hypothetical protein